MLWNTVKKRVKQLRDSTSGVPAKKSRHQRHKQVVKDGISEETQRSTTPKLPPRTLYAHRPRALTLSSGEISANRIADQSNSVLLGKLPSELRQIIWRECIGVNAYHLENVGGMGSARFIGKIQRTCVSYLSKHGFCRGLDGNGIPCHLEETWGAATRPPRPSGYKIDVISMLLSCRQIYSEAIGLLYSINTFIATYPEVVTGLPQMLLPHRLNSITTFRFRWSMNTPPYGSSDSNSLWGQRKCEEWIRVWKTLSRMKALKSLHVELYQTFDSEWMDMEDAHLGFDLTWEQLSDSDMELNIAPIREVTIPEDFILDFGFTCDDYQSAWDTLPCRIISH